MRIDAVRAPAIGGGPSRPRGRRTGSLRLLLALSLLASCGSGCAGIASQATFFTHSDDFERAPPWGTVYSGTFLDLALALGGGMDCLGTGPVGRTLGLVDLPLSLAFESAILPLTIGETVAIAVRRGKEESHENE